VAQEAQARRATAEKMAKEKMEKDRLEAAAKEQKDKSDVVEKARLEEKKAESTKRGQTSSEWRNWVDKQNWMKTEVINVIKADKATRTGLRPTMRLMTRNLGQVTNAKETVLRIVSRYHRLVMMC
jgi:nucleoporin GLE1